MLLFISRFLLRMFFRVKIVGLEHYAAAGKRVLIVANHTSLIDAVLLAAFLPKKSVFAVNTFVARDSWMRFFLKVVDTYPLDPNNPMATKALIKQITGGKQCVIFPEGRITVTGSLMKIYEGPGMIADKASAKILPIRIEGAQYTLFSFLKGKLRIRLFPKIILTVLEPRTLEIPEHLKGRERRAQIGLQFYDLMTNMLFNSTNHQQTLFQSLIDARAIHGGAREIAIDIHRQPITYTQLIRRSLIVGSKIARQTKIGEYIGVLLPNMINTLVVFFALQAYARIPAMLNFTAGLQNLLLACRTAKITRIYTSRQFIQEAKLSDVIEQLQQAGIHVIYLEEFSRSISSFTKIKGYVYSYCTRIFARKLNSPHDPAVLLFTSGSEAAPKGVILSHANLQANRLQLSARVDFGPTDIVFNALPVFHSFGLSGAMLLPVLSGIKTFYYPSPLHYRIIPELIYDVNATILFGTDVFLAGYARFAHPYDFYSVRYIFSGAEKLKHETRTVWQEKFGVRIFEGYGATETSPVISTNTPMHNKAGTVGRLLPDIQYRIRTMVDLEEGGELLVKGPNVMQGYLLADHPDPVPLKDGWYETGDIVTFDDEGYLTIQGRLKRFAKIAGEMISLTMVENVVNSLWPDYQHAVITLEDMKKGEQLLLVTDYKEASRIAIVDYIHACGGNELAVPKAIKIVDKLPLLGTGKIDYVSVKNLLD